MASARPTAEIVRLVPRRDRAWGGYCLWPRQGCTIVVLPVVAIERYREVEITPEIVQISLDWWVARRWRRRRRRPPA